jgi:hypothetical protein
MNVIPALNSLLTTPQSPPAANPSVSSDSSSVSGSSFESTVDQLLANPQSITPQNAQSAFTQAQSTDSSALSDMFSDSTSSALLGLGTDNLFALPAWETAAAQLSGNSQLTALMSLYQQESALVQNQLLGGSDSGDLFSGLA